MFKQAVGIDIVEVPYKSTSQAITDLIGGALPVFPVVVPLVSQYILSGSDKAASASIAARRPRSRTPRGDWSIVVPSSAAPHSRMIGKSVPDIGG